MSDDFNPYKAPESDLTKPETAIPEGEKYTPVMVDHLRKTRPWILFIAILSIVLTSIMVLSGLVMFSTGAFAGRLRGFNSTFIYMGFAYLLFPGLYVPVIVFLFRYSNSINDLLAKGKTESIEKALSSQKSLWKYIGILAIISIAIFVISIIGIIIFGVGSYY